MSRHFSPALFTYLDDLEANNDKVWFDPDHPMVNDLARKDFIGVCHLTREEVSADDFLDTFTAKVRDGAPFLRWLCGAVEVPFRRPPPCR